MKELCVATTNARQKREKKMEEEEKGESSLIDTSSLLRNFRTRTLTHRSQA